MDGQARKGKTDIAYVHLGAALIAGEEARSSLSPDNPAAALELIGIMYARAGDAERALDEIRKAMEDGAANAENDGGMREDHG